MVTINAPRVERAMTKLYVPHGNEEIAFASPSYGQNTYQSVGQDILKNDLKVPTGDYTASLLHSAYCNSQVKDEPEFKTVRDIMKSNWLWVFNLNLWTDKGVYVLQDLKSQGRSKDLTINELEKMLKESNEISGIRFSKDGKVRFAPKESYILGNHNAESLSNDGFVIASYNVEGAKKLAEVSSKFRSNPITYGVNVSEGNQPELRVSALDEGDDRLRVDGNGWDDVSGGHTFGGAL